MWTQKDTCTYFIGTITYLCLCVCAHMWKSEDYSWESLLSFYQVGVTDGTLLFRLNDECVSL